MLFHVLGPSEVKGLWENAISNCLNLCLKNILKVCLQVICFSFAKDINKYKLKKQVLIRKGQTEEKAGWEYWMLKTFLTF